jgi:hypothetical protein
MALAAEGETSPTTIRDAAAAAARGVPLSAPQWAVERPQARPAALPALYGTYAALQVVDVYSTRKAIAAGAHEANAALRSGGTLGMVTMKAAAGAGTIYFADRAWKRNKPGAIALMLALNGATALVAARNIHNSHR